MYIKRCFSAWFLTGITYLFMFSDDFLQLSFGQNLGILFFAGVFICFFLLQLLPGTLKNKPKADNLILVLSLLLFSAMLLNEYNDLYLCIGLLLFVTICGVVVLKDGAFKLGQISITDKSLFKILAALAILFILFTGGAMICSYLGFTGDMPELGRFSNMLYHMKENFSQQTNLNQELSFSPLLYLLLPFYLIVPSPMMLQAAQVLLLASGIIPLFLIMRHRGFSNKLILSISVIYFLYPALSSGSLFEINGNMFLPLLLFWMFYFLEKDKKTWIYGLAILLLMSGEYALVYLATFAIYLLVSKRGQKQGLILLAMAVFYYGLLFLFGKIGDNGIMPGNYEIYRFHDSGYFGFLKTILINPGLVFSQMFNAEKLAFLLKLFLPLAFLPFLTKKVSRYVLFLPVLLTLMTAEFSPDQYGMGYPGLFGTLAFLFYLMVLNVSEISFHFRRNSVLFGIVAVFFLFIITSYSEKERFTRFFETKENRSKIEEALQKIPDEASVRTSGNFMANLSGRIELYEIDSDHPTEYVVIGYTGYEPNVLYGQYLNEGYQVVEDIPNLITILSASMPE